MRSRCLLPSYCPENGQPGRHQQDRQRAHNQPPRQYAGQLGGRPPRTEHYFGQHGYQNEYDSSYDEEEYTYSDGEYSQNDYDDEPGDSIIEDEYMRYEVNEPDHREWRPSLQRPNMGR